MVSCALESSVSISAAQLRRLPRYLMATIGVLTVLHFAALAVWFGLDLPRAKGFVPLFYFDFEKNAPTWYSSCAWLIAAGLAAQIAVTHARRGESERRQWSLIAVVALALSMDEIAGIHELPIDWMRENLGCRG